MSTPDPTGNGGAVPHLPISDAADAAIEAFEAGLPVTANPYAPGTAEHASWWSAWLVQDEIARAFPEDPEEDERREARLVAQLRTEGLDVLVGRIERRAGTLARMLAIRAPQVVLDDARASLRRVVDRLLERTPSQPSDPR